MKVVNIKTYRVMKERARSSLTYRYQLMQMDKASLLQELIKYHETYQKDPHDVDVTLKAQHLMEVLEARAELSELRELTAEFNKKLKTRLYQQMQNLQ